MENKRFNQKSLFSNYYQFVMSGSLVPGKRLKIKEPLNNLFFPRKWLCNTAFYFSLSIFRVVCIRTHTTRRIQTEKQILILIYFDNYSRQQKFELSAESMKFFSQFWCKNRNKFWVIRGEMHTLRKRLSNELTRIEGSF